MEMGRFANDDLLSSMVSASERRLARDLSLLPFRSIILAGLAKRPAAH